MTEGDEKTEGRPDLDLIWGVEAIAGVIGRTPRQTFHMLKTGQLRGVKKIGARWVAERGSLIANFIEA